ncbi:MAG TPA: cupin domain-containing protein [Candidatus Binatia bacterium]|nr:cupin domain-containing protein [Candidatus Binatia bacterium]
MRAPLIDAARVGLSWAATASFLAFSLVSGVHAADPPPPRVSELLAQPLANVPGKEAMMLTVEYPPGGADPIHRHNASAFVYVIDGTVEMQLEGGKKVTLQPGQTFYEDPSSVHLVGRNASDTKPAKFVVFLVKEPGAPALVPVER